MNSSRQDNFHTDFDHFLKLVQVFKDDPAINEKVIHLLLMKSYPRRLILNNWIEQLRISHAPEDLLSALTCLFDDKIAEDVLILIKKCNT